jgi:hypothetical protein
MKSGEQVEGGEYPLLPRTIDDIEKGLNKTIPVFNKDDGQLILVDCDQIRIVGTDNRSITDIQHHQKDYANRLIYAFLSKNWLIYNLGDFCQILDLTTKDVKTLMPHPSNDEYLVNYSN